MASSIFGPVLSRRFGLSLGVDLVGEGVRRCNFDCLYCELKTSERVSSLDSFKEPESIVSELEEALYKNSDIDFITVTANGEPTLYPKLKELMELVGKIKGDTKTLILSNGSTICDESVREALLSFDVVKLSLDSALEKSYKKIDRPLHTPQVSELIECMSAFRRQCRSLVLETLFVKGVNDSEEDIAALNEAYLKILPDRIDLSTIDRPPAFRVERVDEDKLLQIQSRLDRTLFVSVARRGGGDAQKRAFSARQIETLLANRPQSAFDIETLFDEESKKLFLEMLGEGKIYKKEIAKTDFYYR